MSRIITGSDSIQWGSRATPLDMTISAFVKIPSATGWGSTFPRAVEMGGGIGGVADFQASGNRMRFERNAGIADTVTGAVSPDDTWHHVAWTNASAATTFWVDGVQVTNNSDGASTNTTSGAIILGNRFSDLSRPLGGNLAYVSIYDRVLSGSEIAQVSGAGWLEDASLIFRTGPDVDHDFVAGTDGVVSGTTLDTGDNPSITPPGGGTTPVESDRAISYSVNSTATSERAASWDVLTSVTVNRDVLYGLRDAILSDRVLVYDLLGGVRSDRAVAWAVLAAVTVDRSLSYGINTTVTSGRDLFYGVRAGVTSDRAILYAIDQIGITAVTSDRALSWGVLATLNSDRDLIYNTLASLSSERAIVYDVLVSITSDRDATWALLGGVSSDRDVLYAIGGGVISDRSLLWSVDTTGTPLVINLTGSYQPTIAASGSYQPVLSVIGVSSRIVMVVGSIAEMPYLAEIGLVGRYDDARYDVSVYGP